MFFAIMWAFIRSGSRDWRTWAHRCCAAALPATSLWRRRNWRSGLEAAHCALTVSQNLVIIDVPKAKTGELARELGQIGLHVEGSMFWRGAVACTGTEFCKLAITETKGFTRWLVDEMEERLPQFDQQLKLHVTGCPNGCGQHWIADIGLEGKKIKYEGKLTDAFYFCLGGAVGQHAGISRPVGYRCPRRWCLRRSSGCCGSIWRGGAAKRICAHGLRATRTTSCARIWRAKFWSRWSAICRRARAARGGGVMKAGSREQGIENRGNE